MILMKINLSVLTIASKTISSSASASFAEGVAVGAGAACDALIAVGEHFERSASIKRPIVTIRLKACDESAD